MDKANHRTAGRFLASKRMPGKKRFACCDQGAQLAEFAVALPLLIVFVVGIFDFSGAFTLKQKLTNIARDTARAAAADPASDLGKPASSLPYSVSDAFYVFYNYLKANNINDCGIDVSSGKSTGTKLTWQFKVPSSKSSPCGIILTINRGYYFPLPVTAAAPGVDCVPTAPNGVQTQVIGTCVSIQYTYQWHFKQVANLSGRNTTLPDTISAQAVAVNEN